MMTLYSGARIDGYTFLTLDKVRLESMLLSKGFQERVMYIIKKLVCVMFST